MLPEPPSHRQWQQLLANGVSQHYRAAGKFAYHFAKSKIKHDPLFRDIFCTGLGADELGADIDLFDLGCGQGLLATALVVAQQLQALGRWPVLPSSAGGKPLRLNSCQGIEYSAAIVARAQTAFAAIDPSRNRLKCVQGNILDAPYPAVKTIALIDVLHYFNYPQQEQVLVRARSALLAQGKLLLRVGNAEVPQSNWVSQAIDRMVSRWRGADSGQLYCRGLSQWMLLLKSLGFIPRVTSRATNMFFSNVMIVAELR